MNSPVRIVVIGGGITGLAAAWRIQKLFQKTGALLDLQVIESSDRLGGSLRSLSRDGFLMEMGPDCFISEKPRGIALCRELGLGEELLGTRPEFRRSFILRDTLFHPVPDGFYLMGPSRYRPFLESRLLSWRGKLRAMLEPLMPSRPGTDESLASFVRRRFGAELLDWMAQPLVAGIYGASPEHLSLRATFPQFLEMERTYGSIVLGLKKFRASRSGFHVQQKHDGTSRSTTQSPKPETQNAVNAASGARYSLFVSLRRGIQTLADTLSSKLGEPVIRTRCRVLSIAPSFPPVPGGEPAHSLSWQVRLANGETLRADAICLALPSYAAAELIKPFDPDLGADLDGIPYAPAATLNFAFHEADITRPLEGIGFVVPHKENRLVLGCTLAHNKFEGRAPKGHLLVRAFLGGVGNLGWPQETDQGLTARVFAELKNWLGISRRPLFTEIARYDRALPQYNVGHLPKNLRIEEQLLRWKGLTLAGNWQYGVGIPDCIDAGERAAEQITSYLGRPTPAVL